jgi:hypothetical protein
MAVGEDCRTEEVAASRIASPETDEAFPRGSTS